MEGKTFSQAKFLVAEAVVGLCTGLFLIFLMSRIRGQVFLGQYVVFTTWTVVFQAFANLGTADLILRETGKRPEESGRLVGTGLQICLVSSFAAMAVMFGAIDLFGYPVEVQSALVAACLTLLPLAANNLLKSGFIAHKKLNVYFLVAVLEILTTFALNGYFILNEFGIIYIVKTVLIVKSVSCLAYLYLLNRTAIKIEWQVRSELLRELRGPLASFSMIGLSALAFWRVDILMLSKMTTIGITGIYVTASKFLEVYSFLPTAVAQTLFPQISRQWKEGKLEASGLEQIAQKLFYLVVPMSFCTFLFADPLILAVFGGEFSASVPALKVFMVIYLILVSDMLMSILYEAAGFQKNHMFISFVNIASNIAFNLILIPKYLLFGAALATLFSISISWILHQWLVSKNVFRLSWGRILTRPLALGLAFAAPVVLIGDRLHFMVLGFCYVAGYALVYFLFLNKKNKAPQKA